MPIKFNPIFSITPKIAQRLIHIEEIKERVRHLPLTTQVIRSLRESAKLDTTHYSTMIEGNRLSSSEVKEVIIHEGHFPGRERDEYEVKGYYVALKELEKLAAKGDPITEKTIQKFHALVMGKGNSKVAPSPYRAKQNVIKDSRSGAIVYLPPEAKDVGGMMEGLVHWINHSSPLPYPIVAAVAHYQFATIHPYYDGNGRTARLLTTLILHLGGYDLKGLYSLEEYYAKNLLDYYRAISIGPSHNYYLGRAEGDVTPWIDYFLEGVLSSFEKAKKHMESAQGKKDHSEILRQLDPRKRKSLQLFEEYSIITSAQISHFFGFKPRTGAKLCQDWVKEGFLIIVDPSKKGRKYQLASPYTPLLES